MYEQTQEIPVNTNDQSEVRSIGFGSQQFGDRVPLDAPPVEDPRMEDLGTPSAREVGENRYQEEQPRTPERHRLFKSTQDEQ